MNTKELRRQFVHLLAGSILLGLTPFFPWPFFLFILIFSLGALFLIHASDLAIFQRWIAYFDRKDAYLPGYGALTVIAGFLLMTMFFPQNIALTALAVMVFGDGCATIAGTYLGRHCLAWNSKKSWEGLLAGLAVGSAAAYLFLPAWQSIIAATIAMAIETLPKPAWLDDNYLIPLVAGLLLVLLL